MRKKKYVHCINYVGCEVITGVVMKGFVFWGFGGTCILHSYDQRIRQERNQNESGKQALQSLDPEDGGDMFLRNFDRPNGLH
jgi:hypothetical protein